MRTRHLRLVGWTNRLLVANAFDAVSRQVFDVVIDVAAILAIGASALQLGALNAINTLAFTLLGIPVGVLIDRVSPRRAQIVASIGRAAVALSLGAAFAAGMQSFFPLALASFLVGMSTVVSETAQTVFAAAVAGPGRVGWLVSKLEAADSGVALAVPAATGLIVAALSTPWLMGIAAAFSALSAIVLLTRRGSALAPQDQPGASNHERGNSERPPQARFAKSLGEGISTLANDRLLRRLTFKSVLTNLALAAYSSVQGILILVTFNLGSTAFGLLASFGAAGG